MYIQVLGYASRTVASVLEDGKPSSPTIIILMESELYVVVLLFVSPSSEMLYINAASMGPYDIFEGHFIRKEVICLFSILASFQIIHDIHYEDEYAVIIEDIY